MTIAELNRLELRHPKLKELTLRGRFRFKVAAILRDLEGMGFKARLFEGLRTEERQRELMARKVSRTMNSYHLAGRDGLSRAADIVQNDADPWSTHHDGDREFWLTVARLAVAYGLDTGCLWIDKKDPESGKRVPDTSARAKFRAFLSDRSVPFDPRSYRGKVGWDMPHVQTVGVPK